MTRFPHDQFAKDFLESLLSPAGKVQTSLKISSEVREIDVYFTPDPQLLSRSLSVGESPVDLGLLSQCTQTAAYRNSVKVPQILACMSKLYDLHGYLFREAKRQQQPETTNNNLILETKETNEPEDRELVMQLSPLYLEKIQAAERVGEARGKAEGQAGLVLRLLNRRVGALSPELLAQIQRLAVPQLENLGEALLDFTSLADLENWLSQNLT